MKEIRKQLEFLLVTQTTLIPTITKETESVKLSVNPVEHVETQTIPERKVTM